MKSALSAIALAIGFLTLPAIAQVGHSGHSGHSGAATDKAMAGTNSTFADGEVRKVDKPAGKITIKHGPLVNLDMPPMTMVFRAKDAALLDQVKPGDVIRFKAEKIDGNYTVTEYQAAK